MKSTEGVKQSLQPAQGNYKHIIWKVSLKKDERESTDEYFVLNWQQKKCADPTEVQHMRAGLKRGAAQPASGEPSTR